MVSLFFGPKIVFIFYEINGGIEPSPPLDVIYDPATNRVKEFLEK